MGSFKVIFVPRSQEDLRLIVRFIARKGDPTTAERLGTSLINKALTLDKFPERGRVVPELRIPAVREIFFKSYRIVY